MRYFIELSYKGTAYHGWQNQPDANTVQQEIETALSTLLKSEIKIAGAGRTDTGVHAAKMMAHVDLSMEVDTEQLVYKLNSFLPKDISIHSIKKVNDEAHARFDAEYRTYKYYMTIEKDVFNIETAYYFKLSLNVDFMNQLSKHLLGHKNFKCFSRSNTDVKTYNCNVMHAEWTTDSNKLIFTIKADRFLRNMVRAVVGTLLEAGLGKVNEEEFLSILNSEDRTKAGPSAPAHGLFLVDIGYPSNIYQ